MPSPDNPHKRGSIAYRRWEAAWRRRQSGQLPFTDEHLTDAERRGKLNAIISGGTFIAPTPENPLPTINTPDVDFTPFEDHEMIERFWEGVFGPDLEDTPFEHLDVLDVVKGFVVRPKVRA